MIMYMMCDPTETHSLLLHRGTRAVPPSFSWSRTSHFSQKLILPLVELALLDLA